jgi:hypothetical protein
VVGVFLIPGSTSDTPVPFDSPFGQPGLLGQLAKGLAVTGLALHVASLPAALGCVILRFRASRGTERQQLRWVATGAAIAVLGVTVPLGDLRGAWLDPVVILCVPLAVALAVLRYRLWDLDRLVSRTVTYALVTALLVVAAWTRRRRGANAAAAARVAAATPRVPAPATMQPTRASLWLRGATASGAGRRPGASPPGGHRRAG